MGQCCACAYVFFEVEKSCVIVYVCRYKTVSHPTEKECQHTGVAAMIGLGAKAHGGALAAPVLRILAERAATVPGQPHKHGADEPTATRIALNTHTHTRQIHVQRGVTVTKSKRSG